MNTVCSNCKQSRCEGTVATLQQILLSLNTPEEFPLYSSVHPAALHCRHCPPSQLQRGRWTRLREGHQCGALDPATWRTSLCSRHLAGGACASQWPKDNCLGCPGLVLRPSNLLTLWEQHSFAVATRAVSSQVEQCCLQRKRRQWWIQD